MGWNSESERLLLADACRKDFELFCRVGLGFTHKQNRKGSWWSDPVHKPLCAWFQQQANEWLAARLLPVAEQRRRYLALLIPRNCAKSLLITRAGMAWLQLQDPNLSIFIGNETLDLAKEFLGTIKKWLEGSRRDRFNLFNWLYGSWKSDDATWRADNITHNSRTQERSEPSFGIWSPTSALTGRHPDVLCMDDLVSYDSLKKDLNWFDFAYGHMTDLIPVVEPNGLVILVGTRYSDADPFGRCFTSDGIASLAGQQDFPEYHPKMGVGGGARWHVYFLSGKKLDGSPNIPTVWPKQEMDFYEGRDPIKFASQVLNRPKAHRLRALTEQQFDAMVTEKRPARAIISFHCDTAFKSTKKMASGSETALVIVAQHLENPSPKPDAPREPAQAGHTTVLETINGINYRSETFADLIIDRFKYWNPIYPVAGITDESEMAGKLGLWEQYLRDRFTDANLDFPGFYTINRQTGERKETRIANAIAFVVKGQVWFMKDNPGLQAIKDQLVGHPQAFPNDAADAWADSLSAEFFSGLLPQMKAAVAEQSFGAHEKRLKRMWYTKDMPEEEEIGRPALRGAHTAAGASPDDKSAAEQLEERASFFFPWG